MPEFTIMSPNGYVGQSYQAEDAETAARMAIADGEEIIDYMDNLLIVADEKPADLGEPAVCDGCGRPEIHDPAVCWGYPS